MSYLIHFNPNHNPKDGRFTFSPKAIARENKKVYKQMQKGTGTPWQVERVARKNEALRYLSRDEKLQEAHNRVKNAKINPKLFDEPNWYDDKFAVEYATKKFKKDWPDWDKDPTDHKMFDYYMEEGAEKSKTFANKLKKYQEAYEKSDYNKEYQKYQAELDRVAKQFTGKLSDKKFQDYYSYSSAIRFALQDIVEGRGDE